MSKKIRDACEPTQYLRWEHRVVGEQDGPYVAVNQVREWILQQLWECPTFEEWRDVPRVERK